MPEVTGCIDAYFSAADGVTQLRNHAQSYPLKIAKTFPFGGGQLGVYVMDASPGIMAGDRYELTWRFGEDTNVHVTNQSYTKVHPSHKTGWDVPRPSAQLQRLELRQGAYVEYMPEPLMLYQAASFCNETIVELEPGSSLVLSEIVCPGRTHRGERFHYARYQNTLSVRRDDELIFSARQRVEPQLETPRSMARWDLYTHLGTLYLFSDRTDTGLVEGLRERLNGFVPASAADSELYYGVSLTYKHGLAVSVLGYRVGDVQELLDEAWRYIRTEAFGKEVLRVPK
ncbi:urease accessory protein [Paenibacillus tianmuensis]|uniref:Urease accessory protein UreD n=1 Tax=Paenibacillus tianmuensis TaxID=624147 RepID=A0A1G4PFX1_9BACL|nr:urease accessory protein UreD [Paenibacillus tianmuensis]SCW31197.1 urease accessory protein [Paenibacillus tianmuensis]